MGSKNRKRAVNLLTTLVVLAALFGFIYIAAGAQAAPPGEEYTDRADSSFLLLDSDPSLSVRHLSCCGSRQARRGTVGRNAGAAGGHAELAFTPPPADRPSGALTPSPTPGGKSDEPGGDGRAYRADGSRVFLYLHRQRLDLGGARVYLHDPAEL